MYRSALFTTLTVSACLGLATAQSAPAPQSHDIPAPTASANLASAIIPARPQAISPAVDGPIMVPAQTPIRLQMETRLSTASSEYGDGFAARVKTSVYDHGREVIPSGSIIEGHILRVRDERPAVGDSQLLLQPDLLTTPGGHSYTISAEVIQSDPNNPAKLDSEGMLREPRGLMSSDVHHLEAGTGVGVIGGAVLAGASGAAVGAGIGAVVATGVWLIRRRHLVLNPGTMLTVRLDRPLQLVTH